MSEEKNSAGPSAGQQDDGQEQSGLEAEAGVQASENSGKKLDGEGGESADTENLAQTAELNLDQALQRLEEAEELVRKHQDDLLRVQAEMQNLRRRTEQDVEKAHKYGQERFVTELLSVIDNLERALEAAGTQNEPDDSAENQSEENLEAIREGVELTLKSFVDCFRKFSIETIDPLGEPFDPQLHQAMATVEDDKVESNTVTMVMQKGYLLHGRVIRPAMVMVSK